jgi:formamidopyrimidine-DNA glycosylase
MPELPEVETSVQAIQEFANQSLESIEIYNPNLRWKVETASLKNYMD